jgi:hypothetical protein
LNDQLAFITEYSLLRAIMEIFVIIGAGLIFVSIAAKGAKEIRS